MRKSSDSHAEQEHEAAGHSIGFWIISLRVKFGLDCVAEGGWPWRHISLKNILFSGGFTVLDTLAIKLGLATSNQFVVAVKE